MLEIQFCIHCLKKHFSTLKIIVSDEKSVILFPLCVMCYFSLSTVKIFSLVFTRLTMMGIGVVLFALILLGVHCKFITLTKFENNSPIEIENFFKNFFYSILSLHSFWDSNYTYSRPFDIVPQVPEALFLSYFQSSFLLVFIF